ncbi:MULTISPECIES: FAD binding domain-containing protein [unclassified Haladaptatus]|uniref:FAD binding domain-containing protein n=1 Tax=unclassified Haladaptatus TaxID=2622732 RepID=UPI002FCE03CC
MKRFNMAFPQTVGEACTQLEEHPGSRVIAGGTAITVVMKEGVYTPELLINLRGLEDDLRFIEDDGDSVRIGALSTLRDVERSAIIEDKFPTVVQCLQEIAGVRVRNSATLGGHLSHADVHLDLPPVLAGYDAEIVVSSGDDSRQLLLTDFLKGYYETALEENEIVTEIVLPKPEAGRRGTYVKHRYFSEVDWPCVGVAAFATPNGDQFEDVEVLLNSVSHNPVLRLDGVNDVVDGDLSDEHIDAVADLARDQSSPSSDLRGSANYKEQMAGVFTKRALRKVRADV